MLVPKYDFEETLGLGHPGVCTYSVQKYEGLGHDLYYCCCAQLFLVLDTASLVALIGVDVAKSCKKDVGGDRFRLKLEKT